MTGSSLPEAVGLLRQVLPNPEEARRVGEEVTRVRPPPAELEQVSVSRLVNPGRAYWELVHPLPEELAAHQRRLAGSGAHDLLEAALAAGASYTERWLRGEDAPGEPPLDRILGRLDACEALPDGRLSPTEIKNVATARDRPSEEHLEQLGMYCALMGVGEGRVLEVLRDDAQGRSRLLVPWRVLYPDLELVRREMVRRRDLLTEALRRHDAGELPACPWWSAGCRYRLAGVCSCGDRPPLDPVIARSARFDRDPGYLELVERRAAQREALAEVRRAGAGLTWASFLTPRKLYFLAQRVGAAPRPGDEGGEAGPVPPAPPTPEQRQEAERSLRRVNTRGLERQIFSAVRRASGARFSTGSARLGEVLLEAPLVDGRPFQVRVRHVGRALDGSPEELAGRWGTPDDLRQLALRADLLGVDTARLYVWNWKLEDTAAKLQVFDVRFDPRALREARAYAEGLPERLARASKEADHRDLPLCPRWMCPSCPFLAPCGPDP